MKLKLFCVFDSKVGAFLPPLTFRTAAEAMRSFGDACERDGNFKAHPEDYVLFEIGSFDDSSAAIDLLSAPHSLGLGAQLALVK